MHACARVRRSPLTTSCTAAHVTRVLHFLKKRLQPLNSLQSLTKRRRNASLRRLHLQRHTTSPQLGRPGTWDPGPGTRSWELRAGSCWPEAHPAGGASSVCPVCDPRGR